MASNRRGGLTCSFAAITQSPRVARQTLTREHTATTDIDGEASPAIQTRFESTRVDFCQCKMA